MRAVKTVCLAAYARGEVKALENPGWTAAPKYDGFKPAGVTASGRDGARCSTANVRFMAAYHAGSMSALDREHEFADANSGRSTHP